MLEILSHEYLKRFLKSHPIDWEHVYSFGRIISKSIQNDETYLINSEIFFTTDWLFAVLIPLFLFEKNSTLVLSQERIDFLKKYQIEDLKILGFDYILEKDQIIFPNHRVYLKTLNTLLSDVKSLGFNNHRIIFSGIEDIKQELKNIFRISLLKKDWMQGINELGHINQNVIKTYTFLKEKFFLRNVSGNIYLLLENKELLFLTKFFQDHSSFSELFLRVSNALSQGWACWVKLDYNNLEWNLILEPIDELSQINQFLTNNKFVFLSALRKDYFFQDYFKKQSRNIDLSINFKSNFNEKKIFLYVPPKQMLPNNPLFNNEILEKCKKLLTFRKGLTLVLSDDNCLKTNLATELAAHYGKTVLLESEPSLNDEILCASYEWWIKNSLSIQIPEQIIIPLLPIPSMSEPINIFTVSYSKNISVDWFREFFLPEAILKLEKSIAPLRRNSGKLIILDGRANKRKWGRLLLKGIQPSKQISYMIPF